jgi:hypothetical protein
MGEKRYTDWNADPVDPTRKRESACEINRAWSAEHQRREKVMSKKFQPLKSVESIFKGDFKRAFAQGDPTGLIGGSLTEKPRLKEVEPTAENPTPETPAEETALAAAEEAEREKARRRVTGGRRGTILTAPLGSTPSGNVERRSLLGG